MSLDLTYFCSYCYILLLQVSLLTANRSSFFVSFKKPHSAVTSKTLSRWISSLLTEAGVDTSLFQPHATRSAAGVLLRKSLSSIQLCKLADWSTSSGTYEKFYQRYLWWFLLLFVFCQVSIPQIYLAAWSLTYWGFLEKINFILSYYWVIARKWVIKYTN